MAQLQLIFDRQAKTKQEMKEIKAMAAEALENDQRYQTALTELNEAKTRLTAIKTALLESYNADLAKLDNLKADIENDRLLMTDQALSQFAKGEEIIVKDAKGLEYDAVFSVRFKKR